MKKKEWRRNKYQVEWHTYTGRRCLPTRCTWIPFITIQCNQPASFAGPSYGGPKNTEFLLSLGGRLATPYLWTLGLDGRLMTDDTALWALHAAHKTNRSVRSWGNPLPWIINGGAICHDRRRRQCITLDVMQINWRPRLFPQMPSQSC